MRRLSLISALALSAATIGLSPASAAVIYNNGGPTLNDGGNDATEWVQAEDFTFAGATNVAGAGVYLAGYGGISEWDGSLTYFLFADNGGSPGAVLQTANVSVSPVDSGTAWCCGGNFYLFAFDFSSTFAAAAGTTYWLGIHASTNFDRDDIYWGLTTANGTAGGHESDGGTFNNWANNGGQHAFYLEGDRIGGAVPEPGTWAMMLLGFGATGFAMRRSRKAAKLATATA